MTISDERAELFGQLKDAFPDMAVYDHIPNRMGPNSIVLGEGSPYISETDTDGSPLPIFTRLVRFTITLVGLKVESDNTRATDEMDAKIQNLIENVDVSSVQAPVIMEHTQGSYLATSANYETVINLKNRSH